MFESVSAVRKLSRPSIEDMMVWNHWAVPIHQLMRGDGGVMRRWICSIQVQLEDQKSRLFRYRCVIFAFCLITEKLFIAGTNFLFFIIYNYV